MKLKFLKIDIDETLGELEVLSDEYETVRARGMYSNNQAQYYVHKLFCSKNRTGQIEVYIGNSNGKKSFPQETKIRLVNPRLEVKGRSRNGFGITEFRLYADDMVKAV